MLSGSGTSLQYQTALDSISFSEVAGSDPTQGGNAAQTARSVTWTVVDDADSVASATTALDTVHTLSVKAGVTVTFAAGQTGPTFLDSALTVNDFDTVTSATVTVGGFQTGDIVNVTNLDGLTLQSNANGTLVLTGTAAAAVYQTALASITFDEAPGTDPTHGGADTVRAVTWSLTDSNTTVNHSATAASTLDVTPFPSLSGANGAVATYVEGQTPVVLDGAIAIGGSNTVTSATVAVSGFENGDILSVGNLDGLTLASDANGTIVLSGAGSNLQYATALDFITFSEAAGVDPTHGGGDGVRSVTWTIASPQSTSSGTSTLDTVHTLSLTGSATVTFTQGQTSAAPLDSALQVHDLDRVTSATVTVSGFQSGDILSVGNLDGLTIASNANGTLVITERRARPSIRRSSNWSASAKASPAIRRMAAPMLSVPSPGALPTPIPPNHMASSPPSSTPPEPTLSSRTCSWVMAWRAMAMSSAARNLPLLSPMCGRKIGEDASDGSGNGSGDNSGNGAGGGIFRLRQSSR